MPTCQFCNRFIKAEEKYQEDDVGAICTNCLHLNRRPVSFKGAQKHFKALPRKGGLVTDRRVTVTALQRKILDTINNRARAKSKAIRKDLLTVLKSFGCDKKMLEKLIDHMRRSEMTINFKPFMNIDGHSLIHLYRTSDGYKNGFETGFGGAVKPDFTDRNSRNQAEHVLFGYPLFSDKFNPPEQERAQRPKYVALNMFRYGTGAAGRYGSCSLVLKEPGLKKYCTLTSEDSFGIKNVDDGPSWVGTFENFENCLYYMATRGSGKAVRSRRFPGWFPELLSQVRGSGRPATREEEDYWEVQVHATIKYPDDIAYLRAGFCSEFGASYGDELRLWCNQNNWPLVWAFDKDRMILDPYSNEETLNTIARKLAAEKCLKIVQTYSNEEIPNTIASTIKKGPRSHVLVAFDRIWDEAARHFQRSQAKVGVTIPLEKREILKFENEWIRNSKAVKERMWGELWKAMPVSLRYQPPTYKTDRKDVKK